MRIFITGAAGFIGKSLIRLLSSEPNKFLLLAKDEGEYKLLGEYKQSVIMGDLKDIANFEKDIKDFNPEVCIHLAWEGIPDFSFEMCKKNLDNSLALVNFIVNETECKKIIISGTCLEYGKTKGICKETDSITIDSNFTWAKYSLYRYAKFLCRKNGKDLIWFRLFYVYGPGQRKESLIPSLVDSFKDGVRPNISNPLNANDFIYVEDIAEAFRIATNRKIESGIYNLGSGKSTKVVDIFEILKRHISGCKDFIEDIRKIPDSKQQTINFWADISKTEAILDWEVRTDVNAGIAKYVESLEGV